MGGNKIGVSVAVADWASRHDWFKCVRIESDGSYGIIVIETGTLLVDGVSEEYKQELEFHDYKELREWAGY